jgi:DNA polymerase III subunit epsilon
MINSPTSYRQRAIQIAQQNLDLKPVFIDTETTGIDRQAEIIEISIIDHDGQTLFTSLVRPGQPVPAEAEAIHGISTDMVQKAPPWLTLWPTIRGLLLGRVLAFYNADFDLRMMQQSHARYRQPWRDNFTTVDVMKVFADFRGEWDPNRRSMRYFKLEQAGRYFQIPIPNAHRSEADAQLTRAVLYSIAGREY